MFRIFKNIVKHTKKIIPPSKSLGDVTTAVLVLLVFGLPLTLLIPDFSIWNIIPKTEVTRYFVFRLDVSWSQLNAITMALLLIFFCLYLEIRKRKLDEMVEDVFNVSKATDTIMEVETETQLAAIRACVKLLDASGEHYENLILLKDDLRKRENVIHQPPTIELSSSQL